MADAPAVSIVIPTLNEGARLGTVLDPIFRSGFAADCEIIVSDGGSDDDTLAIAGRYPCRVLEGPSGRAAQMNAAARVARGEILWFLHADSLLPAAFDPAARLSADWGFFRLRLDGEAPVYRLIERMINLRSRLTRIAGGDQGLYFGRDFFERLGGFADIGLMEDVEICKRARRLAAPVVIEAPLVSSSRRWQRRGVVRTVLLMWWLRLAYWLGADPARLHRLYYPRRG